MQSFNFERSSGPISEKKEALLNRLRSALLPFLLTTLSLSAEAQQKTPTAFTDSSTMEIKYEHNLDSTQYEKIKKIALEQHAWLLEFMNSQKFYEITSRQYMLAKKFDFPSTEDDIISKLFKIEVDEIGDTLAIIDLHNKGRQVKKKNSSYEEEFSSLFKPDTLFGVDLTLMTNSDSTIVEYLVKKRVERMKNSPWAIVDMNGEIIDGKYHATQPDSLQGLSLHNAITYNIFPSKNTISTSVHEKTHASLKYRDYIFPTTVYVIERNFQGTNPYYKDAGEVIPRLNSIRYILSKMGLFNPREETFEQRHLEILKQKDIFEKDYQIEQLIRVFSEEYIIWFMNNIASNYPNTPEFIFSKDYFDSNMS